MNPKMNRSLLVVSLLVALSMFLAACATPAAAPTTAPVANGRAAAQPAATTAPAQPANKALVGVVLPTKDEPRWLQDQAVLPEGGLGRRCSARATAPRKRRTSKR